MQKYRLGNDFKFTIQVKECCDNFNLEDIEDLNVTIRHTQNGKAIEVSGVVTPAGIEIEIPHDLITATGKYLVLVKFRVPDSSFTSGYRNISLGGNGFEMVSVCCNVDDCNDYFLNLSLLPVYKGKDGIDGEDGLSAYEQWLENGGVGTFEDFINKEFKAEERDAALLLMAEATQAANTAAENASPNGLVAAGDGRAVSGDAVFEDLEAKGLNNFKITQDPVWQYAVTINGRVVFGVKRDGNKLWWKSGLSPELDALFLELNTKISTNTAAISAIKGLNVISDPVYLFAIADSAKRVLYGQKRDGGVVGSVVNLINALLKEVNDRIDDLELAVLISMVILSVGDSLTAAGQYQAEISEQLPGFSVINGGVGGENSRNIVARMGGLRSILTSPVTIPAAGTEVQIGDITNSGLQTLDVDGVYYPLTWFRQGGASNNTINPITIDGIECTLRWTGASHSDPAGLYMLKRNVAAAEDYTTKANTEAFVSSLKKYRRPRLLVAWIGQNGGYANIDALVKQYKALISIVQPEDFVVIGLHSGTAASRADLEKLMTQEFGNRYINWRKYASERALRDMGITPTSEDLAEMAVGSCPPSLRTDAVHLTTAAGRQLGKLIIQTLKNINSWPTIAS